MPLKATLPLVAFACASDTPTRPVDEKSLVLAHVSQKGSSCHIVLSSLERQRRVIHNLCGNGPAWSPDGTRLALDKPGGEAAPPSLWIINVDGSGEMEIPAPHRSGFYVMNADRSNPHLLADGRFDAGWASWSPDGSQVTYSLALGDGSTLDVYVSPSDGSSAPRNLTNNMPGNASLDPDWAPTR